MIGLQAWLEFANFDLEITNLDLEFANVGPEFAKWSGIWNCCSDPYPTHTGGQDDGSSINSLKPHEHFVFCKL